MKKKNIILISAVAVVLIVCAVLMFSGDKNGWSSNSDNLNDISLTEKEKYANFEAEFACQLLGINDSTEMMTLLQGFETLATSHGYTAEQVQENINLYRDDAEFRQLAFDSMKRQCPAKVEAIGLNEFTSVKN